MFCSRHDEITVDLIGKDQYIIFNTDFSKLFKFIPCPDPSHWIVRVTKDGNLDSGIFHLFFKIIKIGMIFFIIQNYSWLLGTILESFAQLAGVVINEVSISEYVFNPAKIWQYGYDAGVNLLKLATENDGFGSAMILTTLGMGILLVFGLLGIQMVVQIIGFYVVSFGALILLPWCRVHQCSILIFSQQLLLMA